MNEALDNLCRAKAGKGEEWSPYSFKVLGDHKNTIGIEIVGANHRIASRGPRKGRRIWGSEGKATVYLTMDEYRSCFPKENAA